MRDARKSRRRRAYSNSSLSSTSPKGLELLFRQVCENESGLLDDFPVRPASPEALPTIIVEIGFAISAIAFCQTSNSVSTCGYNRRGIVVRRVSMKRRKRIQSQKSSGHPAIGDTETIAPVLYVAERAVEHSSVRDCVLRLKPY